MNIFIVTSPIEIKHNHDRFTYQVSSLHLQADMCMRTPLARRILHRKKKIEETFQWVLNLQLTAL